MQQTYTFLDNPSFKHFMAVGDRWFQCAQKEVAAVTELKARLQEDAYPGRALRKLEDVRTQKKHAFEDLMAALLELLGPAASDPPKASDVDEYLASVQTNTRILRLFARIPKWSTPSPELRHPRTGEVTKYMFHMIISISLDWAKADLRQETDLDWDDAQQIAAARPLLDQSGFLMYTELPTAEEMASHAEPGHQIIPVQPRSRNDL